MQHNASQSSNCSYHLKCSKTDTMGVYAKWFMYAGMQDYQSLNSHISFYYHIAYWDRLHMLPSVHPYALSSLWFCCQSSTKRKKNPSKSCKFVFTLMDITVPINSSIKGQIHTHELNAWIKLEKNEVGKWLWHLKRQVQKIHTQLERELFCNSSRRLKSAELRLSGGVLNGWVG